MSSTEEGPATKDRASVRARLLTGRRLEPMSVSLALVCAVLGAFISFGLLGVVWLAGDRGTQFAIFIGMPAGALLGGLAGFRIGRV